MSEWISVNDKLPSWQQSWVLMYGKYGVTIGRITVSGRWEGQGVKKNWITHWMQLPEPPEV